VPVATIAVARNDAEEAGLEKERGEHLIGHQRADYRTGLVGEGRPVGAELVGHHHAGHHAHAEGDGEDLQPVIEQIDEDLAAGPQPQRFKHREIAGKPDRERRKHDVERHRERELRPGQHHGVPTFEHAPALSASDPRPRDSKIQPGPAGFIDRAIRLVRSQG
jgi:hypothetical protein